MPRFYASKRDDNEAVIVQVLERCGATVKRLNCTESDILDLLVGYKGRTLWLEVKGKDGKLSEGQVRLLNEWRGHAAVVRSSEAAVYELLKSVHGSIKEDLLRRVAQKVVEFAPVYTDPIDAAWWSIWGKESNQEPNKPLDK